MRGMTGGHHIHYPRYYDDITLGGEILRTILSLPGSGTTPAAPVTSFVVYCSLKVSSAERGAHCSCYYHYYSLHVLVMEHENTK